MIGANPKQIRCTTRRDVPEEMRVTTGKTRSKTFPVIIPPVRNKAAVMPAGLQRLWSSAGTALRNADEVTFFGYSCPIADTEAEKLFRRALGTKEWQGEATIVNPDSSAVARFADFFPGRSIRYFRHPNDWLSE